MSDNLIVLQPKDRLDVTSSDTLRQEIADVTNQKAEFILVDCQNITFMDSSGLSTLVMALKQANVAGKQFALCALNDQAALLFKVTGMSKVFNIFEDRAAFEQSTGIGCSV